MKRPIFLISTEGKSKEQIKQEALLAFRKFLQASKQAMPPQSKIHPNKPQVTPVTTPSAKTPEEPYTGEFWKQFDKTKEHLGGAIQITNYPHTRKTQPPKK